MDGRMFDGLGKFLVVAAVTILVVGLLIGAGIGYFAGR